MAVIQAGQELEAEVDPEGSVVARLYSEHVPAAVGFAVLLTRDRGFAEDLVQEAFIRTVGKRGMLKTSAAFAGYLRRTVMNLFLSDRRRERLHRRYLERLASLPEPAASDALGDIALRDELGVALSQLPPRQRAAVVLRYYGDLSERQAAEQLGCSEAALRSLVLRGMETLRDLLEVTKSE